jgi:hypothetical protein
LGRAKIGFCDCTVVELSTHNPKMEGPSPASGEEIEKIKKKMAKIIVKMSRKIK